MGEDIAPFDEWERAGFTPFSRSSAARYEQLKSTNQRIPKPTEAIGVLFRIGNGSTVGGNIDHAIVLGQIPNFYIRRFHDFTR